MTNKINGIDVSEEIRYCNNCSNLGLDFKTGKFYCGLSNRKDELPEILSCENFSSNCYIKCLQKENEELKTYIQKMDKPEIKTIDSEIALKNIELQQENEKIKKQYNCYACGNCNGKEDYINLEKHHKGLRKQFDELVKRNNTLSLRIEELEKENEKLQEEIYATRNNRLKMYESFETECNKYKQALEEIREMAKEFLKDLCDDCAWYNTDECNPKGYNCGEMNKIINKIDEALNDRD